jgi:PAS domain S-box-containing protein
MPKQDGLAVQPPKTFHSYLLWAAAAWTILVIVLGVAVIFSEERQVEERAATMARATYLRELQWGVLYGKVYIPLTPDVEQQIQKGAISVPVIFTTSGDRLGLLSPGLLRNLLVQNPQYPAPALTRLIRLDDDQSGGPPDEWEQEALLAIAKGDTERITVVDIDGVPHLRFLGAASDLRSTRDQAWDSLGLPRRPAKAISIAVPLEPFARSSRKHISLGLFSLGLLWGVGLVGVFLGNSRLKRRILERDKALEDGLRHQIERERIESRLIVSEERYARIVNTSREGIWEIDDRGCTTFANGAMADMLGYAVEDLLGRPLYDFMDGAARSDAERYFERRKNNVAEQHDFRLRTRDGKDLWTIMSTNPVFDKENTFKGALAMVTNITRRKAMEEALAESESRYRTLFENNVAGVYRTTTDGVILDCNQAVAAMLGYDSTEELKGARAQDFYVGPQERVDFLDELGARGELKAFLIRLRRRDGKVIWILENVVLAKGILHGTMVDVTERQEAQQALNETERNLRLEKMRMQIAADLHDEIGSTLSSISVFHEMLNRELTDSQDHTRHLLQRAEDNIQIAQESLHEIVWIVNPENDLLENILLRLQQYAAELLEARGIRFTCRLPEHPGAVALPMQRRREVYLIVKESLNNIVRHSRCTEASLEARVIGGSLELTVCDDGEGFRREDVGTGDGLKNMERRSAAIGGFLGISSSPEKGSCITLRVPLNDGPLTGENIEPLQYRT